MRLQASPEGRAISSGRRQGPPRRGRFGRARHQPRRRQGSIDGHAAMTVSRAAPTRIRQPHHRKPPFPRRTHPDLVDELTVRQIVHSIETAHPVAIIGRADRRGCEVSPYSAPARAADLSRLPPTFIDVGACEVFRDEAIDYAVRILASGGQCELHVWGGAFHGFYDIAPQSDLAEIEILELSIKNNRHQGNGPFSLKYPPLGPLSGSVARSTTIFAPCFTVRIPAWPLRSVAIWPGVAALIFIWECEG